MRGYRSGAYGRIEVGQLIAHYQKEPAQIEERGILIRLNQFFRYGMSDVELYDITRGVWRIGEKREKVDYAFAVYDSIIQEVYRILHWFPAGSTLNSRGNLDHAPERWEFVGQKAEEPLRKKYVGKSVEHCLNRHAQNPIQYINIE